MNSTENVTSQAVPKMCEGILSGENWIDGDCLLTAIIPVALVIIMVLLALIIACLLSRKTRKYTRARTRGDSINELVYLKNTKNGVPVIFLDELDENNLWNAEQVSPNLDVQEARTGRVNNHRPTNSLTERPIAQGRPKKQSHPTIPPPPNYQNSISLMGSSIAGPSAYPVMSRAPVSQSVPYRAPNVAHDGHR